MSCVYMFVQLNVKSSMFVRNCLSSFFFFNYYFLSSNFFFKSFFSFFLKIFLIKYSRLKFFGKGYRIFLLKRNSITFNFGFSHFFLTYYFNIKPVILAKFKLFFFGLNYFLLRKGVTTFLRTRYYNLFTSKGIRLYKQFVKKKVGKLSLYF